MHVVNFPRDIDSGPQGIWPKGRYVMEDKNAAEMMLLHPSAGISCERLTAPTYPLAASHIVIAGGLGLGDAIMLTPVLRAIYESGRTVKVACFYHYRQALENLDYIAGFAEWPMDAEYEDFERVVFLENFQDHPKARTHHLTDVFAEICGVELTDHKADYIPTEAELFHAEQNFPRVKGRRRIGLQVRASGLCRTYPFKTHTAKIIELMIKSGWEVYLMGGPREYDVADVKLSHLYDARKKAAGFREQAAFLTTCDAFLGPDSGFLHAAGAMGIPAVGLFGAFPWKLRTAYYDSVYAIQGVGECSPCFHSPTKLQPSYPLHGPCAQTGRCEVLAGIQPEKVVAKVKLIAR